MSSKIKHTYLDVFILVRFLDEEKYEGNDVVSYPQHGEKATYSRLRRAGYLVPTSDSNWGHALSDKGRTVVTSLVGHLQARTRGDFDFHAQIPTDYKGDLHVKRLSDGDIQIYEQWCWTDHEETWDDGHGNVLTRKQLNDMGKAKTARFMVVRHENMAP